MTRCELYQKICPNDGVICCKNRSSCDECHDYLDFIFDKYDNDIRVKTIEEFAEKIRADAIEECIKFIKEHSGEHYIDCDGYFGGKTELAFIVDDWIDDLEQLKEQNK